MLLWKFQTWQNDTQCHQYKTWQKLTKHKGQDTNFRTYKVLHGVKKGDMVVSELGPRFQQAWKFPNENLITCYYGFPFHFSKTNQTLRRIPVKYLQALNKILVIPVWMTIFLEDLEQQVIFIFFPFNPCEILLLYPVTVWWHNHYTIQ